MGLLDAIEAANAPPMRDEQDGYGWRPMPMLEFLDGMRICRQALGPGRHTFLDVGSGVGTKLAFADFLDFAPTGLENHLPYVEQSRQTFTYPVICSDAFDFTGYWRYNLVFFYNPARGPERRQALMRHVANHMSSGSLFFCPSKDMSPDWLEHIDGTVWRR